MCVPGGAGGKPGGRGVGVEKATLLESVALATKLLELSQKRSWGWGSKWGGKGYRIWKWESSLTSLSQDCLVLS